MSTGEDRETTASVELIEGGSELAGAVAGSAIGLVGGPAGAVGGAAAGVLVVRALKRVGYEIHERVLAPRQRLRTGAAYAYAADEVNARLMNGELPRDDGFFEGERPSGEELLEGVLLQASDAYEEQKLPHLGRLYASFVFDDIPPAYAHYLLRLSERLTYRQFVLLAVIGSGFDSGMRHEVRPSQGVVDSGMTTGAELLNLGSNGLIAIETATGALVDAPQGVWDASIVDALRGQRIVLTTPGRDLYDRLGLDRISYDRMEEAVDDLGYDISG